MLKKSTLKLQQKLLKKCRIELRCVCKHKNKTKSIEFILL